MIFNKKMIRNLLLILFFIFSGVILFFYYKDIDRDKIYILINEIKKEKTKIYFNTKNNIIKIAKPKKLIEYKYINELKDKKEVNNEFIEKYKWIHKNKLHLVLDKDNNIIEKYNYKHSMDLLPYSVEIKGNVYYFIYDKMKSLRLVLNHKKQIVKILEYNKNGEIIKDSNKKFPIRYAFAGGVYDKDSKYLDFKEGVFYPKLNKWLSKIKNINIINNIKELNKTSNKPYLCKKRIDQYYHAYLCFDNVCRGFYPSGLDFINTKGVFKDNSYYFNSRYCKEIDLEEQKLDTAIKCIYKEMDFNRSPAFNVFSNNCYTEAYRIIKECIE